MPVSPQDFALWSRMTGNPVPFDPAQRMAIAPQVYQFNQQLAQGRNPLQQAADAVGSTISSVGKAALGLGLLTGAGLLAAKGYQQLKTKEEGGEPSVSTSAADQPISAPKKWERKNLSEQEFLEQGPPTDVGSEEHLVAQAREHFSGGPDPFQSAMPELARQSRDVKRLEAENEALARPGSVLDAFVAKILSGEAGGKLQLDDEPHVDNDVIASNPLSNTALASQDITSADPASAIGQRISTNQTGAAAEVRAMTEPPATVASKLATQQSPVHIKEEGSELVGAPAAGAAEAFRKGRQYQAMKEQYSALRDIASPTTEGVSSAEVLSAVPTKAPVAVVTEPSQQPAVLVTPGVRRTAEQDEQELMMRKYAAVKPRAAATPSGAEFLKTKVAEGLPQPTQRGTIEHAVAEAMEQREGMKTLPAGATAYDLPGSSVSRVVMYPNQQVGITYAADPGSEYGAKSTPEFYSELESILKSGEFGRGGKHSAGGFLQAGKNLGLLY